ncbi:tripartite tricarboxylate transporter substrate-binding protein [Achromobacter sp. GbtcB20]|uniref:tripartite tricarboxylate transporter substrate-binding protein n=1 Tax=Achromobacter sp. GbtcB20 TaxID=2824765 RepID=UPI001C2F79A9|nr:tripartite tricarboxylate transporter substrate-binding protein [Achromobacter sp. GbtcB20]
MQTRPGAHPRRLLARLLAPLLGSALLAFVAPALSDTPAGGTIRIVVGAPPGGAPDTVARIVAQHMQVGGRAVMVENKNGAASMIAAAYVARARPDGNTLLLASQTTVAVAPTLQNVTTFDPMKDFTGVALVGSAPQVLLAGPKLRANSIQELIAQAKAAPGEIDFCSGGIGTSPYMAAVLFAQTAGIELHSIPFAGEQACITEMLAGRLPFMFANASTALPYMKDQRLRALAVTSNARVSFAPQLPTTAEAGLKDYEVATWLGLLAPAATPPDVVNALNAEVRRVLRLPDVREKLQAQGYALSDDSPAAFTRYYQADRDKWVRLIQTAGIKQNP